MDIYIYIYIYIYIFIYDKIISNKIRKKDMPFYLKKLNLWTIFKKII